LARKILLADDSVTAQNMGRKILTDAGYEVVTVNNGSAALKKIVECKPSVVVLDVYMPGYSGLEVCARIKEGRDTEGIPVLLTVGKLEPFRQDEARKVRADAFIVKPFEATELLAALNKLEAKAGNHAAPGSAGAAKPEEKSSTHAAVTMDRYERQVADGTPRFGDHESGWKARLTMPSPGTKHEDAEQEPEITTISGRTAQYNDRESMEPPAFELTTPPPEAASSFQGLPNDVTPDELAAIAAAAAAVGGSNGDLKVERPAPESPVPSDSSSSAPVTFASEPAAHVELKYSITGSSAGPVSAQVEAVFTSFAAAHVAEATATLTPPLPAPPSEPTAAVAAPNSAPAAVRWVAEEVPVAPTESGLVLEREMQKAFAAFAAAEHGASYEPGPVDKTDEPIFASAPPPIGAPTPFASSAVAAEETAATEPQLTSLPIQSNERPAPAGIAQPPAMSFAPAFNEESKHAVVAFGEPHPFAATEPAAPEAAVVQPSDVEAVQNESKSPAAASLPNDWHELRQPTAGPPAASDQAAFEDFSSEKQPAIAEIENNPESAAMAAAASADSSSSTAPDSSLSSIVDNMLAELKPKLMAELAKKLEKK